MVEALTSVRILHSCSKQQTMTRLRCRLCTLQSMEHHEVHAADVIRNLNQTKLWLLVHKIQWVGCLNGRMAAEMQLRMWR